MTAYAVLLILFATALALALNRWPVDLIALAVLLFLVLTGILTPEEGLSGFSSPVTIIVAATYMLGAGLRRAGVAAVISDVLIRLGGTDERRLIVGLVLISGFLSAFLANIAVFALLLPATLTLAHRHHLRPGKVLLPLSIGCNAGGLLTLLGATPNLAAADILAKAGYPGLGLFTLTPIALPAILFAAFYLAMVGARFFPAGELRVPVRPSLREIARQYGLQEGLQELRVRQHSSLVGRPLRDLKLREEYGVSVLEVQRGHDRISPPPPEMALEPDDLVIVEGRPGAIAHLAARHDLEQRSRIPLEEVAERLPEDVVLAEVIVPPRSPLVGHTPAEVNLRARFGLHVIALLRDAEAQTEEVRTTTLRAGDSLLVEGPRAGIRRAVEQGWLIVAYYLEEEPGLRPTPQIWPASAAVLLMIGLAASGYVPLAISSLLAVFLLVLFGALKHYEMYRVVQWRTVIMIAALLPLGTAMAKSGAADLLARFLSTTAGTWGLRGLVAGFFLLTLLLTQVLSNTAVTVLFTPVAITLARQHGFSPYPLVMATVFGSSSSFLTPLTDVLNVTVREQGRYRFTDYLLASGPVIAVYLVLLFLLS